MVLLSVITAFLFFALFPLREESSELLPALVLIFRRIDRILGFSLIIARTKKGTIASSFLALRLPLPHATPCTVGYALAHYNIAYALGALYLFAINTSFIALAAYLVVKLLRFS